MVAISLDTGGFLGKTRANVLRRLTETVAEVERLAKSYAPVDTGELVAGIYSVMFPSEMKGRVYSSAPHTIFVEFGTRLWMGHPFLRPALIGAGKMWGGSFETSIHLAPAMPRNQPGLRVHPGFKPTVHSGTLPEHIWNAKEIAKRDRLSDRLNRKLRHTAVVYHGQFREGYAAPAIQWGNLQHDY